MQTDKQAVKRIKPCLQGTVVAGRAAHSNMCSCRNCEQWRNEKARQVSARRKWNRHGKTLFQLHQEGNL